MCVNYCNVQYSLTLFLIHHFLEIFDTVLDEKTLPEYKDSEPKAKHPGVSGKQTE